MIKSENLTKRFDEVEALSGVSCSIADGSIYGFVGSNGSGKSTFLRLAAGVYKPDRGSVSVDELPVYENPEAKNRIAYVSDELYFPIGADLGRMSSFYQAFYPNFNRSRFLQLAGVLNLPRTRAVTTFSKGMKRQTATLLALCCGARYMFFDETFDGLDPVMRNLIRSLICEEVATRGATAVIASHSLRELEGTCDQLALLHKGGLVLESDTENLQTERFKIQIAFSFPYDKTLFDGLDIVRFTKTGQVSNLILRGDRGAVSDYLSQKQPVLMEILPLSLDELFVYEMNALGYAFEIETQDRGNY